MKITMLGSLGVRRVLDAQHVKQLESSIVFL